MVTEQLLPNQAILSFPAELRIFLNKHSDGGTIMRRFHGEPAVKHLIEAQGVPHTEVQGIVVAGRKEGLDYRVQHGDWIEVIPAVKGSFSKEAVAFLLDNHLGKLARYLRMLGFDCLYNPDTADNELACLAELSGRVLLTRDRQLLMRKIIQRGYWVRSKEPVEQVAEIIHRYDLYERVRPFQRCLRCNGELSAVPKQEVLHRLEPLTRQYYDEFRICRTCDRVYWRGSHFERMCALVSRVLKKQDG